MSRFIALYRGINVGGRHSVKMDALRALHERLGHTDVRNYVQSGNIVFTATGAAPAIAGKLSAEFATAFKFESQIIVIGAKRWQQIVAANPFAEIAAKTPKLVHAGVCVGKPEESALRALLTRTGGREEFVIEREIVYLHAPDGFGTSRFAAGMERAAGVPMTVRNWQTVEALAELARPPG